MENESGSALPVDPMTRREFAVLARVHPDTVKRWARQGVGPKPRRIGTRLIRYDRNEVLAYLQAGSAA